MVSKQDYDTLVSLASGARSEMANQLEEELSKAVVIANDKLPADVVSIHSKVHVVDLDSGTDSELTLVFPHEADANSLKVSILAPMGMALIGLRAGQAYQCKMPNGKDKHFKVTAVEKKIAA